jgi:phage shock protein PspC (stress-responsive transcriptional regulator)
MKEITRIHIAKVSYDAEVEAKKELESYIKKLEAYSTDTEIINDIEIRITEILAERGVHKNGVVTLADVKALKEQLGEPRDFMGEGDMAIGAEEPEQSSTSSRKLFRDVDNAVLGGVMSGIGAFFGVNPVWIRLLFIIVAFASFGTALLVYLVLWIVVPPAKTAADKLQMAGRPVTIASIREINENDSTQSEDIPSGRRILTIIAGIISVFAAFGSALLVAGATIRVLVNDSSSVNTIWGSGESGYFVSAFILAAVSGLLLTTLFVLMAYAAFTQRITRRVIVSSIIVVVLGLASFGTGIGFGAYGVTLRRQAVEANTHEISLKLPETVSTTTALNVQAPGFNVRYVADDSQPNARIRVVTDKNTEVPKVTLAMDGTTLKVTADGSKLKDVCYWPGCDTFSQQIIIYGPTLQSVIVQEKTQFAYENTHQEKLSVALKQNTVMTINSGSVDSLEVTAEDRATISAGNATVTHAKLTLKSETNVDLGVVQTLEIAHTNSCPAHSESHVEIWNASNIQINGVEQPVKSANMTCLTLDIRGENNDRS